MCAKQVGPKSTGLKRSKPRRGTSERDVRSSFALEHLSHKNELPTFVAVADTVANHAFAKHGGEFGSEIADLIGMRKQNEIGLCGFDDLLESNTEAFRRVGFEQIMLDEQNFGYVFRGEFVREGSNAFPND